MIPKKQFMSIILEILKKYSNADNRLLQKDIAKYAEQDYQVTIGRKAIKSNLMELVELGYNVEYTESTRKNKDGYEEPVYSEWYYEHEFSDAELRFLIDYLLSTKLIPSGQREALINKLEGLSGMHFREKMRAIKALPEYRPEKSNYFLNLEILDEAIFNENKIRFKLTALRSNNITNKDDSLEKHIMVSPYELLIKRGKHFLLFSEDPENNLGFCDIENITDIQITDEPVLPRSEVEWLKYSHDPLLTTIGFASEGECVTFTIDWHIYQRFGSNLQYLDQDKIKIKREDDLVTITAPVKEDLMIRWALTYNIEVIAPISIREKVRDAIKALKEKYYD
ncbi:MAG: WYL domain-containing protein [Oscillospiraceae bacterium]|jgi:predicted DNA-binding transcriptional regulator YafY|nr:WYL domain-containing protein [Oscillospiraceae bacterium]